MKLCALNNSVFSFKGAVLNINAASDMHGQISAMPALWQEINDNKKDLFVKEEKGAKNVFAVAGDWFMAGNVNGYKSNPDFNSQKYQLIFFNKLIMLMHKLCPDFVPIFCPGNHDFDAGDEEFRKSIDKMRTNTILTNADYKNSPALKGSKITKSKVVEIPDDKDPNLVHKALFIGAAPGNMQAYNKKIKSVKFSDNVNKPQAKLTPEDVQGSIAAIKEEIDKFKAQNPKGAVILLDHFAGTFQKEILRQKLPINAILSAHEHYDDEKIANSIFIANLSQNFQKLQNLKIKFDDKGDIKDISARAYYPQKNEAKNEADEFYEKMFAKDLAQKYTIASDDGIKNLDLSGIRYQNSPLANFITDVIMHQIKKEHPEADFFALNATAIRGPLVCKNGGTIDNTHLLMTLNGIKSDDADIMITKVTGQELTEIICENIESNLANKERNPLMHYNGLEVNKTKIANALEHNIGYDALSGFITDKKTGEPIKKDALYNFANVEKFFIKGKTDLIQELYTSERTKKTELNAKQAFEDYFIEGTGDIKASREQRIR